MNTDSPAKSYFNPRPPRGGRLPSARQSGLSARYFNPRPPRGGRLPAMEIPTGMLNFNPRPPRGGRPTDSVDSLTNAIFQSTSSARRTTETTDSTDTSADISIHVLREEDDPRNAKPYYSQNISIHVLREEDDQQKVAAGLLHLKFQSTSSARRTTNTKYTRDGNLRFQSTSSARRTTALLRAHRPPRRHFNPRPPRGGRRIHLNSPTAPPNFNPRPPRGGRR